jgi:integral membrane protein
VKGALLRFRVMSYVVGTVLIVLMCVAVPLRYLGDRPHLSETISPVHGFLFIVYLVAVVDLARRRSWSLLRTVGVMLAGTIPFVSFLVERRVTSEVVPAA